MFRGKCQKALGGIFLTHTIRHDVVVQVTATSSAFVECFSPPTTRWLTGYYKKNVIGWYILRTKRSCYAVHPNKLKCKAR